MPSHPNGSPLGAGQPASGDQLLTADAPFSHPELQAMAMDGLIRPVYGASYILCEVPDSPALRALAAAHCIPASLRDRSAMGRGTAAWIYGCASPPDKLSLLTDRRRRTTALRPFSDAVLHEVALGPLDVAMVGGVKVTTPLRTAMDIALHGNDDDAIAILSRLGLHPQLSCSLEHVAAMLASLARAPGKHRALTRLQAALQLGGAATAGASGGRRSPGTPQRRHQSGARRPEYG